MKKPILYVKNEKGRYERYIEPELKYAKDTLYIREGNKYKPYSILLPNDWLQEGIWIVTRDRYSRSCTNEGYIRDKFSCIKACDVKQLTSVEVGEALDIANILVGQFNDIIAASNGKSNYDICTEIGATIINGLKKRENENKEFYKESL